MARHAELPHEKDVQRHAKCTRDLMGNGYTAARQPEHNDVVSASILLEQCRQLSTGVGTAWQMA